LKPAQARRYIGKPIPTLENVAKSTGEAKFGLDVRQPGLLRAAIRQAPVFGAQLHSVDEQPALAVPGVKKVVKLDNAVAVVAVDTWTAIKGVRALNPKWSGADEASSSADIEARLAALMKTLDRPLGGKSARKDRTELAALRSDYRKAARKVEATYETAYLAHATLEPMNTTVRMRADGVEVWSPTQVPTETRKLVADTLKRPVSEVVLHTTLIGGGYGRRLVPDFAQQAALIAKACADAPVQLVWPREEDTGHDYYRRPVVTRFRAGLRADGLIDGFEMIAAGADDTLRGDGPGPAPYPLTRYAATQGSFDTSIPQGPWRSVNPGLVAFGREGFVDECAFAAGADALDYRRRLLGDNARARRVLDAAAEAIGWGQAKPKGTGRGLALVQCFGSLVATALEAQVTGEALKVTRMAVAADLGTVVNPQQAAAQLEGGATMGLSAALGEAMTFSDGKANETNFNAYKLLRLRQAPKIEVRLLESPDAAMGGVGEVGVPGVAPALANAVFDATGKRVRRLPFSSQGFLV
jgi:isoquinoline 1-oxidoreductase beta subunit